MGQKPHRHRRSASALLRVRRGVVEIAVHVEHVDSLRRSTHERLHGPHHDAAVATDQQRNMPGLLQDRPDTLADTLPGDSRSRPAPDRRDRVMRQIAGDRDVPVVERRAAGGLQPLHQLSVAVGLSVVFGAGVQRAGAEGDSQDVVGPLGRI
jgi:hypothetical protein